MYAAVTNNITSSAGVIDVLQLRLFGHIVEVSAEELNTLDIIPLVQLLVDRMSTVSGATHWKEENVLSRRLFESEGHRDTTNDKNKSAETSSYDRLWMRSSKLVY